MIKVKIQNPTYGRNEVTFRPFLQLAPLLREYSIDITDSDDYDFLFVGMQDFIDKKRSLTESIEMGLESISKITGDYFLFDGSDSTSLMGAYEVFKQSNAIYLFKNQKFKNRESYQTPYAFNKWFFGSGSELDLSYDISENDWNRIKLSNINCGRTIFGTGIEADISKMPAPNNNKQIDICAIFQAFHKENYDHNTRNDLLYTNHRSTVWNKLKKLKSKYNIISEKRPFNEYMNLLHQSKICISPFGMGEVCFRDFESMLCSTILIKPDQSIIETSPNIYVEGETYIGCKLDWSDLEEKIDYVFDNFKELNESLTTNIRNKFVSEYTYENFCLHYYNLFSNLSNITQG